MTASALIKRADLKRMAEIARQGLCAEVVTPDGYTVRVRPGTVDIEDDRKLDKGKDIQI